MADNADRAGELIEIRMAEAEELIRRQRRSAGSLRYCIDCDDEIPERRRALGGIRRCVDCQEDHEMRVGHGAGQR